MLQSFQITTILDAPGMNLFWVFLYYSLAEDAPSISCVMAV
jgi:hypothetical protein